MEQGVEDIEQVSGTEKQRTENRGLAWYNGAYL